MNSVLSLRPSYYEALKRLTLELAGVNLGDDHAFLIETRLAALARKEGYKSLMHMIEELFGDGQARLALRVVSSLLERDSHFNADPVAMTRLRETLIPDLMRENPGRVLRLLSFSCNSGQDTLSLAIMMDKLKQNNPHLTYEIVGVDYPSPALDRAKTGLYTHFEVQRGLPIRDLVDYFNKRGEDWIVKNELRSQIDYKEHHLLGQLSDLGDFHMVMFRNGLPHYSNPAQIRVLRSLSSIIKPGGYLVLGSDENAPSLTYNCDPVPGMHGTFKRRQPNTPNNPYSPGSDDERSLPEEHIGTA